MLGIPPSCWVDAYIYPTSGAQAPAPPAPGSTLTSSRPCPNATIMSGILTSVIGAAPEAFRKAGSPAGSWPHTPWHVCEWRYGPCRDCVRGPIEAFCFLASFAT